jgi:8-oxo-dGTP pyrophosphatase MutT (NUDIX family)
MPLPDPKTLREQLPEAPCPLPSGARQAAVAVALRWQPDELAVLLMRRRAHADDPWSGQISLPGGHTEPSDADLFATARREAHEELGVDLGTRARPLGLLPARQAMARGKRLELWITPCVFEVTAPLDPQPGPEADEAFWLPLGPAARGELAHDFHYEDERRKLILPAWRFEKRVIWGLTFRMLNQLLDDFGSER